VRKVLLFLLIAALGFLALVALQPSSFEVSRTATLPAPPSVIFPLVNDLHRWDAWSPWAKLDPHARMTYDGSPAGQGAVCRWSGNAAIGAGKMTITESQPETQVRLRLEFVKPFAGKSDQEFDFEPAGAGTRVTWSLSGHNDLLGKAMGLFTDMDRKLGGDMERGLAGLRAAAATAGATGTVVPAPAAGGR
jgi:uncharacterized protein YndB with AHSA1/START domain